MAQMRVYRTYNYIDKDPIIDKVRTVLKDEGLLAKLRMVHELSGVAISTLDGWFHGDIKRPQNPTVEAVLTSIGYERQIVKTKDLNYDRELKKAADWLLKQNTAQSKRRKQQAAKRVNHSNGSRHRT